MTRRLEPEGWPVVEETPAGVAVTWDCGGRLDLVRWQVGDLVRLLEEYARRWE